jgi:hypothetical protein
MSTRRKVTMIVAIVVAVFVLGPVGFHFYLRWECARYRAELTSKGEKLKYQQIVGAPPLDAQNGAPALRNVFAQLPTGSTSNLVGNVPRTMTRVAPGRAIVGWQQPDLWSDSTPGETSSWVDMRQELERYAPVLREMRSALAHSAFDFNLNYAQGATLALPHLARLKRGSQMLKSSAMLHLHEQNLEAASHDLNALIAFPTVLEKEPLMISQFVRIAQVSIAIEATWEALQAGGWTDAQLAEMQKRWAAQEFMEPFLAALMMERAMILREFDQSRGSYTHYKSMLGMLATWGGYEAPSQNPLEAMAAQIQTWTWPIFGSYQTERRCLDISRVGIDALRPAATNPSCITARNNLNSAMVGLGFPTNSVPVDRLESPFAFEVSSIDALFAEGAVKLLSSVSRPFTAKAQAEIVITAIALKRYQLRHGKLPPDLAALVPDLLPSFPRDAMNGQSLQYRPQTNSTFLLYSVGTDGEDNGGDPSHSGTGSTNNWLFGRDWVWPQPATPEEVEQYNRRMREQARKRAEEKPQSRRKRPNS